LYACWAEAGLFPVSDLNNLRKLTSDLEGHPTPRLNFIDVATGSLGQGLSCAAGMAYTGKYLDKASYRVYCLLGDGESAEGSIWEAMAFAGHYKLDNLVAIIDVNRLGQSDPTQLQHQTEVYQKRIEAFGLHCIVVDGHDVEALCKAFHNASTTFGKPTCIVAKTFKGKGCPNIEDMMGWHGKALGAKGQEVISAIEAQISNHRPEHGLPIPAPVEDAPPTNDVEITLGAPPSYEIGAKVATRQAYGKALVKIGHNQRVISLDGDMKNSTFSQNFRDAYPDRFVECFIAEQNLVGVGIGCATRHRTVAFVSTFACFLSRAYDQIRMGAISQTNVNFCGSHCGVSIGEDGPSQMALEDLAMFRAIPGSTVFYPSDAVSAEHAVRLAANKSGICFIRTSRPATPVIYANNEQFAIGQAKVIRESADDKVTVVAACVTLVEAMKAYEKLKASGIMIRVIDPFTIKPIDADTIIAAAKATGGRIITVEDHYPEGGIGEAVAAVVSAERDIVLRRLAVQEVPRSGTPDELIQKYGIGVDSIVAAVHAMLK